MTVSRFRPQVVWSAFGYATVIALVVYATYHEGLGLKLILWNCIPPTLGLLVVTSASGKSKHRILISTIFGLLATAVTAFFFGAWFVTPLDTDPHSSTTAIAFVFGPVWALSIALVGSGLAWLMARRARL